MDINEKKAKAYDLFIQIERLKLQIQRLNEMFVSISNEIQKESSNPKEKADLVRSAVSKETFNEVFEELTKKAK